jgi:hypothetical protein
LWDCEAAATARPWYVFVNSLADVFEDWGGPMLDSRGLPVFEHRDFGTWAGRSEPAVDPFRYAPLTMDACRARLFNLIGRTPHLTYLLVTKRPELAGAMIDAWAGLLPPRGPTFPNAWLLASVESQEYAAARLDPLVKLGRHFPVLGASAEPLLGPLDLRPWLGFPTGAQPCRRCGVTHPATGFLGECEYVPPGGLSWVIVGGESGHDARPMDLQWARDLASQCRDSGAACFVKQLGSAPFDSRGADGFPESRKVFTPEEARSPAGVAALAITLELMAVDLAHPRGGDPDEWPEDLRVRQYPGRIADAGGGT